MQKITSIIFVLVQLFVVLILSSDSALAQAPTADCSTAAAQQAVVGSTCNPVSFNVNSALGNPAAPSCGFPSTGEDGWAFFIATATSTTVTYTNTSQDAMIFIYTDNGTACTGLAQYACADAFFGASTETVTFATTIGQRYYVRICRYSGTAGNMAGSLCVYSAVTPTNNLCSNAAPLSCGTTITATTIGATADAIPAGCGSALSPSVWYSFLGDGSLVSLDLCFSSFDTQISVFTGTCAALTCFAFNDDDFLCGVTSYVEFSSIVGTIYYIEVHGWGTASGAFEMIVDCIPQAANDPCSGAVLITCGQTVTGSTVTANTDIIPAGCGISLSGGVWYSMIGDGDVFIASLCGSTFDTQLSVFTGTCAALTCVDANDDYCGLQSQASWQTVLGTTYYILVHGYFDDGPFTLTTTCIVCVDGPQDCSTALTICADTQFGGNACGPGPIDDLTLANQGCLISQENQTSWYVFQPTTVGTISFAINPIPVVDYDFAIWGPLTSVACPPVGNPLRCSWSGLVAPTGLGNGAVDLTEGAGGNAWVAPITVGAADINKYYVMVLDNFIGSFTPFVFDWTLGGVILNCGIMLPVEMNDFTGEAQGLQNVLHWTTLSETNNDYFEVQSSKDGIQFSKIGMVDGNGNSFESKAYSFTDKTPTANIMYYQLNQVDFNGVSELSEVIAVERKTSVRISPNPIDDMLNFSLIGESEQELEIKLTDVTGRIIIYEKSLAINANGQYHWDTSKLSKGLYYLSAVNTAGELVLAEKVVKK